MIIFPVNKVYFLLYKADILKLFFLSSSPDKGFPGSPFGKLPLPVQEMQVWSLILDDPLEKEMTSHSSILAWKSHGQRSLAGYSPWGRQRVGHDLGTKNNNRADKQQKLIIGCEILNGSDKTRHSWPLNLYDANFRFVHKSPLVDYGSSPLF